jgi:hypothetical protein
MNKEGMAKTLIKLDNGLRIKYLVKPKKYFLFRGSAQIMIDNEYPIGFDSVDEAISMSNTFIANCGTNYITK